MTLCVCVLSPLFFFVVVDSLLLQYAMGPVKEPGTLPVSPVPLVWESAESNPKLQGGWCRPDLDMRMRNKIPSCDGRIDELQAEQSWPEELRLLSLQPRAC